MVNINWTDEASFWLKDNPKIDKEVVNEISRSRLSISK